MNIILGILTVAFIGVVIYVIWPKKDKPFTGIGGGGSGGDTGGYDGKGGGQQNEE